MSHQTLLSLSANQIYDCVTSVIDPVEGDEIFDPSRILEILQANGVVAATDAPEMSDQEPGPRAKAATALLERLYRRFRRTTLFVEDAEDGAGRIVNDPMWPELRELLLKHGIVKTGTRPASGPRKVFLRPNVVFRELLARERVRDGEKNDDISRFWSDVRSLDP